MCETFYVFVILLKLDLLCFEGSFPKYLFVMFKHFFACVKLQENGRGKGGLECNDEIHGERGLQNKLPLEGRLI